MSRNHDYWVYMMSNKTGSTLYIGVTNDCAHFRDIRDAIAREKQLKGWRREKKNALIAETNPRWDDLAAEWF